MRVLKFIILFCSMTVIAISCDTDKSIEKPDKNFFMKLYGTDGDQKGVDLEVLSDGSMLLLGNSVADDGERIYLVKVNSEGEILWQKKLGSTTEKAVDIEPLSNGNFVIASSFTTSGVADVKLILVSPEGTKLDSATHGYPTNDFPKSVTPLLDGGFLVTGGYEETLNGPTNIFHFRCDMNLDWITTSWDEDYGNPGEIDMGTKIFQVSNNLFYVFGTSNLDQPKQGVKALSIFYYSLNEFGKNGSPAFAGPLDIDTKLSQVCKAPPELGGNFAVVASKLTGGNPSILQFSTLRQPFAFDEIDKQFDTEIGISGRSLNAVAIAPSITSPTGYFLLANEARTEASNIWLSKIDQSATLQWSVSLGSEKEIDEGAAVKELPDGKILVLGTVGIGDNQSKMALFKLNSLGRLQE